MVNGWRDIIDVFLVWDYTDTILSWCAFVENPAIKGYRNFIKKHGGRECAYHRQVAKLLDGKLHDNVEFEILASEFKI